jgi:Zn-dependent peptidase ImmA (M78 family)
MNYSLEYFEKLAKENKITVVYYDCSEKHLKAFIVKVDGEYYVCIDSNASMEDKKYMLAQELAHFFTKTFYNVNDSEQIKIKNENIAIAYMRKELLKDEK